MVVAEQYPQLKANAAFQDLRVQLEAPRTGSPSRNHYIKTVAEYKRPRAQLPDQPDGDAVQLHAQAHFTVANEAQISTPPVVSFDKPASK